MHYEASFHRSNKEQTKRETVTKPSAENYKRVHLRRKCFDDIRRSGYFVGLHRILSTRIVTFLVIVPKQSRDFPASVSEGTWMEIMLSLQKRAILIDRFVFLSEINKLITQDLIEVEKVFLRFA